MLDFITGPLFIISIAVFVVGLLVRAVLYVRGLDARLERVAYSYHTERSIPGALASIFKWLIPGGTSGWCAQPGCHHSFLSFAFRRCAYTAVSSWAHGSA